MLIPEIIRKKRDGHALSTAEIQRFVQGAEGEVTDAQIAAFAMASIFQDISTASAPTSHWPCVIPARCSTGTPNDWGSCVDKLYGWCR